MKLPIKVTFRFPTAAETGRALGLKPKEIREMSALAKELMEKFPAEPEVAGSRNGVNAKGVASKNRPRSKKQSARMAAKRRARKAA